MSKGNPRITVRFDPKTLERIQKLCDQSGQTVADFIRDAALNALIHDDLLLSLPDQTEEIQGQVHFFD